MIKHEHIEIGDKVGEQRIAAAAIDREMKLPVADQEVHRIVHRLLLDRKRLFEADERGSVDMESRFRSYGALDEDARLVNEVEIIGVDRARAGDADLQRVDLPADDRVREPWLTATTPLAASAWIAPRTVSRLTAKSAASSRSLGSSSPT